MEVSEFDPAAFLETPEDMEEYLNIALESGDKRTVALAIGAVARAQGMQQVARDAGLSRESLYRSLGPNGNPTLDTILKVSNACGLKLSFARA